MRLYPSWMTIFCLLVASVIGASRALADDGARLEIELRNVRSTKGTILLAIYHESVQDAFPHHPEKASATLSVSSSGESVQKVMFKGLPMGRYAISVLHDENDDKKMNFTFYGKPKEGFAFSNNPAIFFGAPSFRKAGFEARSAVVPIVLEMKYL